MTTDDEIDRRRRELQRLRIEYDAIGAAAEDNAYALMKAFVLKAWGIKPGDTVRLYYLGLGAQTFTPTDYVDTTWLEEAITFLFREAEHLYHIDRRWQEWSIVPAAEDKTGAGAHLRLNTGNAFFGCVFRKYAGLP